MNLNSGVSRLLTKLRLVSIRDRLLATFLLMVLIPAVAFGAISGVVGLRRGQQQVLDKLEAVAVLKEAEINAWAQDAKTDLTAVMIGDEVHLWTRTLLSLSSGTAEVGKARQQLHARFDAFLTLTQWFEELDLLDPKGLIVLSTNRQREGGYGTRAIQSYYREGHEDEYLYPPSYSLASLTDKGIGIVVVQPLYDGEGQFLGVLAGRTNATRLNEIMLERTGLGKTSETYLVASNQVLLTAPRLPAESRLSAYYVFSEGAIAAVQNHSNGSGVYTNLRGEEVVGVYRWLPELQVALLAEQSEHEAMAAVRQSLAINVGVAIVASLIAVVVSALLARTITLPLRNLAQAATRVSDGEIDLGVTVESEDEIGAVARAFNSMTVRLQGLINSLDQEVRERTRMLRRRAVQLETSTRVGREITSILQMEELLRRVVDVIVEAFGYYHVAIYLVDIETGKLIFRSGAGKVAKPGSVQGFPLEVGPGSLNGEAAAGNQAIVVADVTRDPRFFADEKLPETQSELVVPLRVGERVIGTLDVQSVQIDAFDEADVRIIQGLGDQVAVAIENARLYAHSRTLAVMEERNRMARELHDAITQSLYGLVVFAGAGRELGRAGNLASMTQQFERIEQIAQQTLKEMRLLLFELRPLALEQEGLAGALQGRLEVVERRAGVSAHLRVDETIQLSASRQRELYRIAQEALNNALKHATASEVEVALRRNGKYVELEVVDDGIGFDVDQVWDAPGFGLIGMRERVAKLGGSLIVSSSPGAGTRITVRVPLQILRPVDSTLEEG
jgi:nitrate/nitrite-specific signal transduction histidine kinase